MRITFVFTHFFPNIGGTEIPMYQYARELINQGHKVTVLTTNLLGYKPARLPTIEVIDGIKVKRLRVIPTPFYRQFAFTPSLIPEYLSIKTDIIIVFSILPSFFILVSILLAKLTKTPLVLYPQFHPNRYLLYDNPIKRTLGLLFDRIISIRILKMADYVIALTKAEAYYYKRNGLKKIQVIPEAVSTLKPCHPSELHKFRSKYGINENDKVLLMVSRIVWYKGINFAIKTLPFLLEKFCNIKLLVVGPDGGNKDRCIEFAKKLGCETNVIFTGEISDKELDCAFEMADVVLVLSIFEAYGRVVLEAWAHKKPVIVTKSVGSAELLSKERGFVIDYGDYLALAKSIIELLTNTALASRMAANGYNFVESEFKWKRSVEKMLNLYNKLLP